MVGRSFRDLIAWQKAMDLVDEIYSVTKLWPREEMFGLTAQIRRAAISVTSNIAEGQGRSGSREFLHHLSMAHGSLSEVENLLVVAQRQGYLDEPAVNLLFDRVEEARRLLRGLIRKLRATTPDS
jgi:four helix bundle protein